MTDLELAEGQIRRDVEPPKAMNRRNILGVAGIALATAACEQVAAPTTTAPKPPTTTRAPATTVKPVATTTTSTTTTSTSSTTSSTSTTSTTTPPAPGTAPTADLLIDKLTWGPTPGLRAEIETRGVWGWIDDQLSPDGLYQAQDLLIGYQTLTNTNYANREVSESPGDHVDEQLDHATILRNRYSKAQLLEQMCDFWNNHLNAWRDHNWMKFLNNNYHETVIRPHALGSFEDMLVASAHHPAMLNYLDNQLSNANGSGGPNENYARELMELHTLGIIDGTHVYSETDVVGAAKLMSGWTLQWGNTDTTRYVFQFAPWMHSQDAISVLGGGFSRPSRNYGEGYEDGVAFLRYLANHESTATHIALKLCKRFVSDVPSAQLVASTAATFSAANTQIAPTLRHIFESDEFRSSHRAKVRRPLDAFMATIRSLDMELGNDSDTEAAEVLVGTLSAMGQGLNERPSPDGYPDHAGYWVSSEGLLQRWRLAGLATRDIGFDEITIDNEALLPASLPATTGELVAWLSTHVFNVAMDPAAAAAFCDAIGLSPTSQPTTVSAHPTVLSQVLGLLLCQPTFHRR